MSSVLDDPKPTDTDTLNISQLVPFVHTASSAHTSYAARSEINNSMLIEVNEKLWHKPNGITIKMKFAQPWAAVGVHLQLSKRGSWQDVMRFGLNSRIRLFVCLFVAHLMSHCIKKTIKWTELSREVFTFMCLFVSWVELSYGIKGFLHKLARQIQRARAMTEHSINHLSTFPPDNRGSIFLDELDSYNSIVSGNWQGDIIFYSTGVRGHTEGIIRLSSYLLHHVSSNYFTRHRQQQQQQQTQSKPTTTTKR